MCGIAGIYSFNGRTEQKDTVRNMTNAMAHRGPDSDGFYSDDQVALGHRRLSIIDLSDAANQPFTDHSGRYRIIFNGEIYNYAEIKAQIPSYPFRTSSDTEALVAAYEKWGPECLQRLKGMFVFIIWDTGSKTLFIARDRMGVKPLYYYLNEQHFIFASEIRALLATGLVARKINANAIMEFLSYQSVGFPESAIENIQQLDAGSYCLIENGRVQFKKYWDITCPRYTDFDFTDKNAVHKKIRELLFDSVKRRLVSDVPLGAFLSGGIDSSAVVALMAQTGKGDPNTFTIGFEEKEFDESAYAEIIARKYNTRHNKIILKPTVFLEEVVNALDAMDTPTGDGVNTYVVSKAIRQSGLKVALSGVGGDELFAGYPFFKKFLQIRKYQPAWSGLKLVRQAATAFVGNSSRGVRMRQLLRAPECSIRYFYPGFRSIVTAEHLSQLTAWPHTETMLHRQMANLPATLEKFPALSQVSIAEYTGYTQHTLLKDTDQMSMAVSLEVREPFFDHDLVEFVLAVPDKLKYPAYPKQLLVESLNGLLPDEIVHRKKQGFLFPWSVWMKNELRSFCETRLKNLAQRDFIQKDNLLKYWQRFIQNDPSVRWMEIWLFVILEYWMEKNGIE